MDPIYQVWRKGNGESYLVHLALALWSARIVQQRYEYKADKVNSVLSPTFIAKTPSMTMTMRAG